MHCRYCGRERDGSFGLLCQLCWEEQDRERHEQADEEKHRDKWGDIIEGDEEEEE